MTRVRVLLIAMLALLGTSVAVATPASASAPAVSYYVSLGDSLAQGIQPDADGKNMLTNQGYPDQLYAQLKKSHPGLVLVKLGCPGETTTTFIKGGVAVCPAVPQLTVAAAFLRAHRGHVAYLTIDVGSNDVLPCIGSTIDPVCLVGAFKSIGANLTTILRTVRANLNTKTVISAGMTYYDPVLAAYPLSPTLAKQSVLATDALNVLESGLYRHFGFRVAPVAAAFQTNNFTIPAGSPVPVNVAKICSLTWMCTLGNIHPNVQGYALIARTFAQTLGCDRRHR